MGKRSDVITNATSLDEEEYTNGPFHCFDKVLTPTMRERGGALGVSRTRVKPGETACPFHSHQLEDEVFYVLSGVGVLRYGDDVFSLVPGDCVACPAGIGTAHQLANTGTEDLIYLAIGIHTPNEVCVYPDSDKVMVRSLGTVGRLEKTLYREGEPNPSRIVSMKPAE